MTRSLLAVSRHCWQRHSTPRFGFPISWPASRQRLFTTRAGIMTDTARDYDSWPREKLIARLRELDGGQRPDTNAISPDGPSASTGDAAPPKGPAKAARKGRRPDPSKYSTRFIALKFAYLGKRYGPYEHSPQNTKPSIEQELWRALTRSCLIFPEDPAVIDFSCCGYSKCGRTDVGVSSFGQVISLWVRSNRPVPRETEPAAADEAAEASAETPAGEDGSPAAKRQRDFDPVADEIQYCRVLNRILPDDIRVYAWCPSLPPGFDARHSCRERRYRYFFTQPGFLPAPSELEPPPQDGQVKNGWLDIEAMRDAARRFEGKNDLRNFCQVDGSKMITDFRRDIYSATIEEVPESNVAMPYLSQPGLQWAGHEAGDPLPKVYSFNVNGSGFLWHQIRRMVGILFLVGQGLEKPQLVTELLDVAANPRQPTYAMADETPLVLWDCIFPERDDPERREALEWVYCGDDALLPKYGPNGLMDTLWRGYREKKLDEVLAHQLLQHVGQQGSLEKGLARHDGKRPLGRRLFEGGNSGKAGGSYTPVLKRQRMASVEEVNDKAARRKGYANADAYRARLKAEPNGDGGKDTGE